MTPMLLTRDQLDARLVDGDRLHLTREGIELQTHCRVMHRDEEVPMEIFTEYRNRGLLRCVGDTDIYV